MTDLTGKSKLGPDHYGLNFMIRSWVWFAFSRRSFFLLSKLSTLANAYGISMDQIFCGENSFSKEETGEKREMHSLKGMILLPRSKHKVTGEAQMDLSTVPSELLKAVGMHHSNSRSCTQLYENRWILLRCTDKGNSSYYATAAFQRDIASWNSIKSTFEANEKEVKDLWLPPEENLKYAQALLQQISLHHSPKVPLVPTRGTKTKIKLLSSKVEEVECAVCLAIPSLDKCFFFIEYFLQNNSEVKKLKAETSLDLLASVVKPDPTDFFGSEDQSFWDSLVEAEWTPELEDLFNKIN
eukprot:CAMPEP_0178897172 /NCGR_PEP_ID=MMETSP0786-20121207/1593_1 /TAXON_ID=186022 /ORGANISM="Thalassionema frauenfeldii, Strain CCMP 1798" /LENGTH=296 /DNA_ID=CAMNT_0020567681 /DNA_START=373 /DNA_END=1263 /DNA_ORIENTATION=+